MYHCISAGESCSLHFHRPRSGVAAPVGPRPAPQAAHCSPAAFTLKPEAWDLPLGTHLSLSLKRDHLIHPAAERVAQAELQDLGYCTVMFFLL